MVSSEVIEHFPVDHRARFVNQIARVLKPDGHVILTTPNAPVSRGIINYQPLENHFTIEELSELLSQCLDVLEVSTTHSFFPVLCNRWRLFQALRLCAYSLPFGRRVIEHPRLAGRRGLFIVLLARLPDGAHS